LPNISRKGSLPLAMILRVSSLTDRRKCGRKANSL
jgi:hypothetical protein